MNLEFFSDSNCTQPLSQYLASTSMIDDLSYINSMPRSVIGVNLSQALTDPNYCVTRHMNAFPHIGYVNVACSNVTDNIDGYLYLYGSYNSTTDCNLWWQGDVMEYRLTQPKGTTPGAGCYSGSLVTSWFNQTSVNRKQVRFYGRYSCTSNDLPPAWPAGSNGAPTNNEFSFAIMIFATIFVIVTTIS